MISLAVVALGVTLSTVPAHAASTITSAQVIAKSDTAISARMASLTKIKNTIGTKYKHLTDAQRTSITGAIQNAIDAMNTLKAKIDGETDLTLLRSDYASITKDYRIYAVVIPSAHDLAVADSGMASITTYQNTLTTLNTRISTAQTAGKDVSALQTAATDASAKLTDAQTQAQAVITAVTSLKVDNGDKTIQASNKAAVAAGKTAEKALASALKSVKKDINTIRTGLKTLKA